MDELAPLAIVDDRRACPNCPGKLDELPTTLGTLPVLDCWDCRRRYWLLPDGQIVEAPTIVLSPRRPKR